MPVDLESTIAAAAAGPAEAEGDGQHVKQQPLPDLIAADQYLASKTAVNKIHKGLRITQLVPPGTE